jgi:hypothetical protein
MTTTLEFHEFIALKLDSTNSQTYSYLEPQEYDKWLNDANIRVLKQRLFGTMPDGVAYDTLVKRTDDIQPLLRLAILTPTLVATRYEAVLPNDYMFSVDVYCNFTRTKDPYSGRLQRSAVEYGTNDLLSTVVNNNVDERYQRKLFYNYYNGRVFIACDANTVVNDIELRYVKPPRPFNLTTNTITDLPVSLHEDICNEAVLGIVESYSNTTRVQTMPNQIARQT